MATQYTPIETRYAGCRFRSRLEARWAVAFDHLGIKWEYEPQGFEVTDRLNLLGGMDQAWGYLPDFWLPELELWVEVKGAFDTDEAYRKFLSAAAFLSSNGGGGCHDNGGHDVVILGPIPRPERRSAWPIRLHFHKGELIASGWAFGLLAQDPHDYHMSDELCERADFGDPSSWCFGAVASDSGVHRSPDLLVGWPEKLRPAVVDAYTAARSARFEHGESGTPRPNPLRREPITISCPLSRYTNPVAEQLAFMLRQHPGGEIAHVHVLGDSGVLAQAYDARVQVTPSLLADLKTLLGPAAVR